MDGMKGRIEDDIRVVSGVAYHIFKYVDGDSTFEVEYILRKFPKKDRSNGARMRSKAKKYAEEAYEGNLADFTKQCRDIVWEAQTQEEHMRLVDMAQKHADLSAWSFDYDRIKKLEGERKAALSKINKIEEEMAALKRNAVENSLRTNPTRHGLTKENVDKFIKEYLWSQ